MSKWKEFEDPAYRILDLGRPAVFFIPSHKLRTPMGDTTVEEHLRAFLMEHFGAFTTTLVPQFGFWRADDGRIDHDECRCYEVAFLGKEPIKDLLKLVARIATLIDEDCIYFNAGQYTCLVYPTQDDE